MEKEEPKKDTATVLYIGHIPHGFYEDQMEGDLLFCVVIGEIKLSCDCCRLSTLEVHFALIQDSLSSLGKLRD